MDGATQKHEVKMASRDGIEFQKLAYGMDEAAAATGLGRRFLFKCVADGALTSIKVGGRRLILAEHLIDFLMNGRFGISAAGQTGDVVSDSVIRDPGSALDEQMELPWSDVATREQRSS